MKFMLLVVTFISPIFGQTNFVPFRKQFREQHFEPSVCEPKYKYLPNVQESFIEQKLDHSNENETTTWKMRYFANTGGGKKCGAVFIFIGGEYTITSKPVQAGLVYEIAKSMEGFLFYLEHRFYGKSMPFKDLATDNLKYLTVNQTLADILHFINNLKKTNENASRSNIILIGSGYAGFLVTMFSHVYPNVTSGGWASSAPTFDRIEYKELLSLLGGSVKTAGGNDCYDRFKNCFSKLQADILSNNTGSIRKYINYCDEWVPYWQRNQFNMMTVLVNSILGTAINGRNADMAALCKIAMSENDHAKGCRKVFYKYLDMTENQCLKIEMWPFYDVYADVKYNESVAPMRQWYYQVCSELGLFPIPSPEPHCFNTNYTLLEIQLFNCEWVFGSGFEVKRLTNNNNYLYNVLHDPNRDASRLYFTQGDLDPMRGAGVHRNADDASVIPGYGFSADFCEIGPKDTEEMKESKTKFKKLLEVWIER